MNNKVIVSGHLEFGSDRNYQQVYRLFEHRRENCYHDEIFLVAEEIFFEEQAMLDVPRTILHCTDRQWRSTIALLKQIAGYGVSGDINIWRIRPDKPVDHLLIEPKGDRTVTQAYLRGRNLLGESGREQEARQALNEAIEKFERHAQAYERRGYVNYRLGNERDAIYDYTKSISINSHKAEPYYGRGLVYFGQGEWEDAISDFAATASYSIPHQQIFWRAQGLMGDALVRQGKMAEAIKVYTYFFKGKSKQDEDLLAWERRIAFNLGRAYMAVEEPKKALAAFDQALAAPLDSKAPPVAEILLHRGLAAQQMGESSFRDDWRKAAAQGSARAAELLQEVG